MNTPSDHANDGEEHPSPPPRFLRYRCPHCGQMFFCIEGDRLPDMCDYCNDMTTWKLIPPPPP